MASTQPTPTTSNASRIQSSQHQHRLNIIRSWFPNNLSIPNASTIVEIGCGQGDMTVALASNFPRTRIFAIDPAPLNYGSPETLGQAQNRISNSSIGGSIQWVQEDPLKFLAEESAEDVDYFVLAHSIWYLSSESYFRALLNSIKNKSKDGTKLLLCEWGMRTSNPAAQAHLYAVEAQALHPFKDGNVRTLIRPERIVEIVNEAGWEMQGEKWLDASELDDGKWEIASTRTMNLEGAPAKARELVVLMEEACKRDKLVKSMDVWTGVFGLSG